jgi:hypothetical protein
MPTTTLAMLSFKRDNWTRLLPYFKRAVEISPNSFTIHYNLADALLEKGQLGDLLRRDIRSLFAAGESPPPLFEPKPLSV